MSEKVLNNLSPKAVFKYFEEICGIPHGSGDTKRISDYLVDFAINHGLKYVQDESNNIIIYKPASKGYENKAPVIIQGHMDMVCQKDDDVCIDFKNDGLTLYIQDGWISARGTTLGADDGIAVAFALAILEKEDICHPPLEVVITVDEEIGMLGAQALDCSVLKGRRMLNLDNEEEGQLLVSCAGGATVSCMLPVEYENLKNGAFSVVTVKGIRGGHSGMEIVKGGANADKVLAEVLKEISAITDVRINSVSGGDKDNAIPVSASATIYLTDYKAYDEVVGLLSGYQEKLKERYKDTDPDIELVLKKPLPVGCKCTTFSSAKRLIGLLNELPNGVIKMSEHVDNMPQTSLNLGILNCVKKDNADFVNASLLIRSSVNEEKTKLVNNIEKIAKSYDAHFSVSGEYPAWEYKEESGLRKVMSEVYQSCYGKKPEVLSIHAGVECGIFAGKLDGLDCVSYGPLIRDIHTTKEALDIESTRRSFEYTLEVLKNLD